MRVIRRGIEGAGWRNASQGGEHRLGSFQGSHRTLSGRPKGSSEERFVGVGPQFGMNPEVPTMTFPVLKFLDICCIPGKAT